MTTATLTLTEFLLARIADDEAQARASRDSFAVSHHPSSWIDAVTARVLAECEAKRRIVGRHKSYDRVYWDDGAQELRTRGLGCEWCGGDPNIEGEPMAWPCPDLRDLASIYADHSDYREEWRP